jgi:23S rRNA (guanosine2251-2'-O)-methyltransferase
MKAQAKEVIGGRNPVKEALDENLPLDAVWTAKGMRREEESAIRLRCRERRVPYRIVPPAALQRVWKGNHQGVLAFRSAVPFYQVQDLLPGIYEQGEAPLLVLLDGVTDVRNMGAIARTALGAGAHALVVGMRDVARFNEEAVKASAGALLHLPICREEPLWSVISLLRESGVVIAGAMLEDSQTPDEADLSGPLCLVMGSEATGISDKIRKQLDLRLRIPQSPRINSYNVGVATGMMLYEIMRQRQAFR